MSTMGGKREGILQRIVLKTIAWRMIAAVFIGFIVPATSYDLLNAALNWRWLGAIVCAVIILDVIWVVSGRKQLFRRRSQVRERPA